LIAATVFRWLINFVPAEFVPCDRCDLARNFVSREQKQNYLHKKLGMLLAGRPVANGGTKRGTGVDVVIKILYDFRRKLAFFSKTNVTYDQILQNPAIFLAKIF
jgi:hypothetical protein